MDFSPWPAGRKHSISDSKAIRRKKKAIIRDVFRAISLFAADTWLLPVRNLASSAASSDSEFE